MSNCENQVMKVGILYICIGKYSMFWNDFYQSVESNFLRGVEKQYFVFTDSDKIKSQENIIVINQVDLGWPNNTLLRFEIFLKAEHLWQDCSHLIFFNANLIVKKIIRADEILPDGINDDGLFVTLHPGYYNKKSSFFPIEEKQKKSTAHIDKDLAKNYFAGGLNGGLQKNFTQLIRGLNSNINLDLENNIIAIWHDESHINSYMIGRNPKIISPAYLYPENWILPFEQKIVILDKKNFGGHSFLRSNHKININYFLNAMRKMVGR
jgi:Glycosyltransferase family 6